MPQTQADDSGWVAHDSSATQPRITLGERVQIQTLDGTFEKMDADQIRWSAVHRYRLVFQPEQVPAPAPVNMTTPGYHSLSNVLQRAYDQAATGKGAERHAQGEPFDEQVMQQGAQRFGHGALLYQAFKKSEESQRLPHDAAIRELLGAINYLAGAVIALEKKAVQ